MTKLRIFLNWLLTVILGSIVLSIFAEGKLQFDTVLISIILSAALSIIPLIIMLISQSRLNHLSAQNVVKRSLIIVQTTSYIVIFLLILGFAGNFIIEGLAVYLVGLPYLLIGISLTLAVPNQKTDNISEIEELEELIE